MYGWKRKVLNLDFFVKWALPGTGILFATGFWGFGFFYYYLFSVTSEC